MGETTQQRYNQVRHGDIIQLGYMDTRKQLTNAHCKHVYEPL